MAGKSKDRSLALIQGKKPTVASLPLCMDSDAFSELGLATQALSEAEARLAGLVARHRAMDSASSLSVEIAEIEGQLEAKLSDAERARLTARAGALKAKQTRSGVQRLAAEIEEQERVVAAAREREEIARQAVDEATVTFRARAVPAKLRRQLLAEHPPSDEQREAAREELEAQGSPEAVVSRGLEYNPETFPPALMAHSIVAPKMTEEFIAGEIWGSDNWNESEKESLWQLVLVAQSAVSMPGR